MAELRDRIEAVLWEHFDDAAPSLSMRDMADAVIAALGLRRESKPTDYDHRNYPPGDRYITDWIPNE